MADAAYNRGKFLFASAGVDWSQPGSTVNVLLLDNAGTYVFSADHNFVADLTPASNEFGGTGYTRQTLANKAVTENDTTDLANIDADDVVWAAIDGATAQAAVVFVQVTNDADSPLIAYFDTGFPFTANGGQLTWQFNAAGVFTLS